MKSLSRCRPDTGSRPWWPPRLPLIVVVALLSLGLANVVSRATFHEVEDGVLWVESPRGVVVGEVAPETPAASLGLTSGDVLLAIDDRPIVNAEDVVRALHRADNPTLRYTVLRRGGREVVDLPVAPIPSGPGVLYFLFAAVGVLTLLVGATVRVKCPDNPATLHFFWLSVAFFGLLVFSFSGRLDRLDWVFYWADVVSTLLLPALFLHFALVFPDRGRSWSRSAAGRFLVPAIYAPAAFLGVVRIVALVRSGVDAPYFIGVVELLDRIEYAYLVGCLATGLFVLLRAVAQVPSMIARRQLRWIAWGTALGVTPFALGYALPWAMGIEPSVAMQLSAIPLSVVPLAYASAIARYRLLDVEVIVKRTLVYAAAVGAIGVIYVALLQWFEQMVPGGEASHGWLLAAAATAIALLFAPWVKHTIQDVLDRAFYRDRFDYRRALIGFARDLNSDLDLARLSQRLVARVMETLLVDRMALMILDEDGPRFNAVRAVGFGGRRVPRLPAQSGLGARLRDGHVVALDDPMASRGLSDDEMEPWLDEQVCCFIPCVSNEGTIAVLALGRKETGDPITSEDTTLLTAVAGQVATALENARLYRQLHVKAAELDRLRTFNENILESLDDGLLVVDLHDRVLRWNRALERLYGISRSEAVGRLLSELFDPPLVDAICTARREAPDGTTLARMPVTGRQQASARTMIANIAVVPLRALSELKTTPVGTIVIVEDVTQRVELEEQLQISEKMASIGLLAAGVAHEVNTPLTGISSFTQMLLDGTDPEDPKTKILEKIERQTFRAARIVNGLLSLSRPPSAAGDVGVVDINAVVNDVLSLLEHQFEVQRVRVRRDLFQDPVPVLGSEQKLQQVFLNLFINAKDAMAKGGWLSIVSRLDDGKVSIEVADTGSGIPAEHLARIYDPFFTTKAIGRGTGLGLSISYGIVREHGGSIDCDSTPGKGTRFVVEFPVAQVASPRRAAHE